MEERQPIGVISIGSNDIHLLVATSDGITTFERQVNQSMLAELIGEVQGGVVPIKALYHALRDLQTLVTTGRVAGTTTIIAIATEELREVANGSSFIELVSTTLGIQATLISGQEEAALDFCWAPSHRYHRSLCWSWIVVAGARKCSWLRVQHPPLRNLSPTAQAI